jgi:hypothetical protein
MSPAASQLIAALESHALKIVSDLAAGGANVPDLAKPIADARVAFADIVTLVDDFLALEAKLAAAKATPPAS